MPVDAVIEALESYLNRHDPPKINVVRSNETRPKPPKPYIAYTITSPYIPESGQGIYTFDNVPIDDSEFEYDVKSTRTTQPTMTISFGAYADVEEEAYAVIEDAHNWFAEIGYEDLKDMGFVVSNLMAVEERDVYIETLYEFRKGFDVQLRFVHELSRIIETIETVELEGD